MTKPEQLHTVDQAILTLEQIYVHRQQKEAQHAVNPLQRLRLLRHRVENSPQPLPDARFHGEMVSLFTSLRDLHTSYILPREFQSLVAYLPFLIEPAQDGGKERFLVTRLIGRVRAPGFGPGCEVLHWNGTPIHRAIELNGERQAGGNPSARFAQGLHALTIRPLARTLPPDEEWVTIGYRAGGRGAVREARFPWSVRDTEQSPLATTGTSATAGLDLQAALIGQARRHFFAKKGKAPAEELATAMPGNFRAYAIAGGRYGYLRIFSFDAPNAGGFVEECRDLLSRLPADGLVLDVRGNPGGNILAAEQLLQLFTPRRIAPAPMQFLNTPLVRRLCELSPASPAPGLTLAPWLGSVREAVQTGAIHSQAFPLTSEEAANEIGQVYYGPVLLITDPLCYSACDMFAAGFQDHAVGDVLGVGGATGAGGANVWRHDLLIHLFSRGKASPFEPLAGGANITVAIRRSLRTGLQAGSLLEEFGVRPDVHYQMRKADVLGRNEELIAFAVRHLDKMAKQRPARTLAATNVSFADGLVSFTLTTRRLKRVDAFVDNRPMATWTLHDGTHQVKAPAPLASPRHLRLLGYTDANAAEPVAATRARI